MSSPRRFLSALLACTAIAVVSCGDPTDPPLAPATAAPAASLLGGLLNRTHLLACTPLSPDSVTQVVGAAGGTIVIGPHRLVIPAGALEAPTAITARIGNETANVVHFQPDGLRFDRPAALTMSYANCGLLTQLLVPKQIVQVNGGLSILRLLPSIDNLLTQSVTAPLQHFSDYAVAFSDYAVAW